jgi:hypothetical protein
MNEDEYLEIIRSAKSYKLELPKNFRYSPNESQIGISITPPVNCDIRFKLGTFKLALPKFRLSKEEEQLPKEWNNFNTSLKDEYYNQKLLST